jgi:hypothetical protein
MTDREVKRLTPNSIANLLMADEAWHDSLYVKAEDYDSLLADFEALRTHLAAPRLEPEPVALAHCPYTPPPSAHFGYVLGDHWLETAYSRVLDGEAEAEVLKDCGWERVTDAEALRQDAERYRWMTKDDTKYETRRRVRNILSLFNAYAYRKEHIDAAIDAAMQKGDKT